MSTTPGLLVIEAGAKRLRHEGHTRVVDTLWDGLREQRESGHLRMLRYGVDSLSDLEFGMGLAKLTTYDGVVILGHGSSDGHIEAAPGIPLPWEVAGRALAPLKPRVVLAVSCYGGAAGPTRDLFDTIPSLDVVMGSPVPLTSHQALLAMMELVPRIYGVDPPKELSWLMTILNAVATGGIVWCRTREDFERNSDVQNATEDLIAIVAKLLIGAAGGRNLQRVRPRQRRVWEIRYSHASTPYRAT